MSGPSAPSPVARTPSIGPDGGSMPTFARPMVNGAGPVGGPVGGGSVGTSTGTMSQQNLNQIVRYSVICRCRRTRTGTTQRWFISSDSSGNFSCVLLLLLRPPRCVWRMSSTGRPFLAHQSLHYYPLCSNLSLHVSKLVTKS